MNLQLNARDCAVGDFVPENVLGLHEYRKGKLHVVYFERVVIVKKRYFTFKYEIVDMCIYRCECMQKRPTKIRAWVRIS